jgi:TonB family protein
MTKPLLFQTDGSSVSLGERIGRGGEGEVYALANDNGRAVKVYTGGGANDRREKIAAMLASGLSQKTDLAAFPIGSVQKKNGDFAGFIMKKISGHKPLHELYSPRARKDNFPQADFRFLVCTALNFSRAVGSVHAAGCVIGDINHSGILISGDAKVSLIDADSFQIVHGSRQFLCRVGVPDYTPPELQGAKLSNVVRTVNHDNFGLSVVIFHLLFMGRHPFSGSFRHGDMPIERAIAERRFVYSTQRNVEMTPPPAAPLLKHFPNAVGNAFEQAFGLSTVRPTPNEWISVLGELDRSLRKCGQNQLHHYSASAPECPWCRMERLQGITLFLPAHSPSAAPSPTRQTGSTFRVEVVWAAIRAVQPPPPAAAPNLPAIQLPPSASATALRAEARRDKIKGGGALATAIGFAVPVPGGLLLWLILGGYGFMRLAGAGSDPGTLKAQQNDLRRRWDKALLDWQRAAGPEAFQRTRSELEDAKNAYERLSQEEQDRIAAYWRDRRENHLNRHLSGFYIRSAKIKGVGVSKTATLASYGIETAADFRSSWDIEAVPGFGPATASNLLAWRSGVLNRFVYNPNPNQSDNVELAKIRAECARREADLRVKLTTGAAALTAAVHTAKLRQQSLDPALRSIHDQLQQIASDLRHVHDRHFPWALIAFGALCALLVLAFTTWSETPETGEAPPPITTSSEPVGSPVQPVEALPIASQVPPPDAVTSLEEGISELRYAVRQTNIRARPTTGSPIVGKLNRGDSAFGAEFERTPGGVWLKITRGALRGYYVAVPNLSPDPRPTLDPSISGQRTLRAGAPAYADPGRTTLLRDLEPGTVVTIVGGVSGSLAEVTLADGQVAYVDLDSFDRPALKIDQALTPFEGETEPALAPAQPVRPIVALSSLISEYDYPTSSVRNGETGAVSFNLRIGSDGRVKGCSVVVSSGHTNLDRATCQLMSSRARFHPATDVSGVPQESMFSSRIVWRLD